MLTIKTILKKQIKQIVAEKYNLPDFDFQINYPPSAEMGDYSCNVAMILSKELKKNPLQIAEEIIKELSALENFKEIKVANPGFINFYLSRYFFIKNIEKILEEKEDWGKNNLLNNKKVMVEYTQPNPFKPFHIGHLMSNAIGESISRIVEFSGAKTIRANYQGDVGPHVAKAIYILLKEGYLGANKSIIEQAEHIGNCYVKGNDAFENDPQAKREIEEINKKIYEGRDEKINKVYEQGKKITLAAFEELYKILGTKFDYYFFESAMAKIGEKIVRENIGKIFQESDEAIVFHGEVYDKKLHTRVFITSQGLPTYEAKEIGLTITKFEKENLDISIVTTANEQVEYMKVVQKAISVLRPELEARMKHITHGMMRLSSGKMSSRKGNVVTGESLINDSIKIIQEKIKDRSFDEEEKKNISTIVGIAALKYSILKSSLDSDIVYDFEKSISFDGDSGPYLQYTAVRANSLLNKAKETNLSNNKEIPQVITTLEKLFCRFPEIIEMAYCDFSPNHITTYLTELTSAFNTFYSNTKILEKENKYAVYHLKLVKSFFQTIKNGLWLLGVQVPEKM